MTTIGKGALFFLGGVLFGTAGVKVLSSKDAKKAYTHCTAAALRAKDSVMKTVTTVQENAEDAPHRYQGENADRHLEGSWLQEPKDSSSLYVLRFVYRFGRHGLRDRTRIRRLQADYERKRHDGHVL